MKHLARITGFTVLSIVLLAAPQLRAATEDSKGSTEAKKVVEEYFQALNESKLETNVGLYYMDSIFL